MFSQFRQAVESFAPQPPRRGSQDVLGDEGARSRSPDRSGLRQSLSSPTGQMAETALLNLKKSLVAQRSGSPGIPPTRSASLPDQEMKVHKSNLEERLRAKFAIGEASNSPSPSPSARASPASTPVINHPLSPSSTPLPESPVLSPVQATDLPEPSPIASPDTETPPVISSHAPPFVHSPHPLSSLVGSVMSIVPTDTENTLHPEADIPLPQTPEDQIFVEVPHESPAPESPALEVPAPELPVPGSPALETATVDPSAPPEEKDNESNMDTLLALQERLKLVEQRFSDVSTSFKRLQAEKLAADSILRELTPLESMQDAESLRDYLQNVVLKAEISQDEIKRLNGKLTRQEERIEELRDTHRLESASRSDQIERLRKQVSEAEALLKASQELISQGEDESSKQKAELSRLQTETERWKVLAKEEEEKRVKAVSLLKTVRQKLVKAEKDKEEAAKEMAVLKERERGEREKERVEKTKLQQEVEAVNVEREKAVIGLKAQFDREVANLKDRFEKEVSAIKGQFELEAVTSKGAHVKEISAKNSQIASLENSVNNLSQEKNTIFDQLQLRQAELESSQSHLDSLQGQNTEFQYQLRECNDRIALLSEELFDARREHKTQGSSTPAEEVAHLLSAAETKYESKIAELRRNLSVLERERNEGDADWSRKMREKTREVEDLKRVLESSAQTRDQNEGTVTSLQEEIERLRGEVRLHQKQVSQLQLRADRIDDVEEVAKRQQREFNAKAAALEQQIEECKNREAQLRANNKTLREELRKVQSSAALLEKQRNPGVGYWTSRTDNTTETRTSISSSTSDLPSRVTSPRPGTPSTPATSEEEVNLEYLRNVILQFLEHKEMRPNLVRVLSIILHFTPQETRRLVAKV